MWNVLEDDQPPEDAVAFVAQVGMGSKGVTLGSNGVKLLNPGEKNDKTRHPFMFTALHRKLQNKVSSVAPCASPLGPSKDHDKSDDRSKDNATAFFVSQGSHGIVDLGASLSVIGDQQLKELCAHLPSETLRHMKESPCAVNFRFGNDATVMGKRGVFIPIGNHWIKVIAVPSNTPFLIANSVFRGLGACIDTEKNEIWFRKLQCTVPIQLSDRKLFMLDIADLIHRVRAKTKPATESSQAAVCTCQEEMNNKEGWEAKGEDKSGNPLRNLEHPKHQRISHNGINEVKPLTGPKLTAVIESNQAVSNFPTKCVSPLTPDRHVSQQEHRDLPTGRSFPSGDHERERSRPSSRGRGDQSHDLCRSRQGDHHLREGQTGQSIYGGDRRSSLCGMVRRELQEQHQAKSREVHPICAALCREAGDETNGQGQGLSTAQADSSLHIELIPAEAFPIENASETESESQDDTMWEQVSQPPRRASHHAEMNDMQNRLLQIEDTMQQVLQHLSQQSKA